MQSSLRLAEGLSSRVAPSASVTKRQRSELHTEKCCSTGLATVDLALDLHRELQQSERSLRHHQIALINVQALATSEAVLPPLSGSSSLPILGSGNAGFSSAHHIATRRERMEVHSQQSTLIASRLLSVELESSVGALVATRCIVHETLLASQELLRLLAPSTKWS